MRKIFLFFMALVAMSMSAAESAYEFNLDNFSPYEGNTYTTSTKTLKAAAWGGGQFWIDAFDALLYDSLVFELNEAATLQFQVTVEYSGDNAGSDAVIIPAGETRGAIALAKHTLKKIELKNNNGELGSFVFKSLRLKREKEAESIDLLWRGEQDFGNWEHGLDIRTSLLANAKAGDQIVVRLTRIEGAQIKISDNDWREVAADWDLKTDDYILKLTAEQINSLKAGDNFHLQGKNITVTRVELYSDLALEEDNGKNSEIIAAYDGINCNVTINRAFTADGGWYTLCLPFDLSAEQVAASLGGTLKVLDRSSIENNTLNIYFKDATEVVAGRPYLYMPNEDKTSLSFQDVTIDATVPEEYFGSSTTDMASMKGTYGESLPANRYVLAENNMLQPGTEGKRIRSFRAYFNLSASVPAGTPARIVTAPNAATGIDEMTVGQCHKQLYHGQIVIVKENKVYNMQGIRLQ